MKYEIYGRRQHEVNTDPQRRCYNGCHASSEWVWSDWYQLGSVSSLEEAKESVDKWKNLNPTRHEYKYKEIK